MKKTPRIERKEEELNHFCTIDGEKFYDANFAYVHDVWSILEKRSKRILSLKYARMFKISKSGNLIRVNGQRKKPFFHASDEHGDDFYYTKVKTNSETGQFAVSGKGFQNCKGGKLLCIKYRAIACTFLVIKDLKEVDHIDAQYKFNDKNESNYLGNLQFLSEEEHKKKTANDLLDRKKKKNTIDPKLGDLIDLQMNRIIEMMEGKTYHSKSFTPKERVDKARKMVKDFCSPYFAIGQYK